MNEHVAKPIDPRVLFETLARFHALPGRPATVRAATGDAGLPRVDGLDSSDGLSRVGGNRTLYWRLLRQFVDQHRQALHEIRTSLAAGDPAAAQRHAHTLRGLAGNLGAARVHAAAGAIEDALRAKAPAQAIDTLIGDAGVVLDPLMQQLAAALAHSDGGDPRHTAVSSAVVDVAKGRAAAEQLIPLLDAFDASAVDFVDANEADLRGAFQDPIAWETFIRQVRGFAFADAGASLHAALKGLKP